MPRTSVEDAVVALSVALPSIPWVKAWTSARAKRTTRGRRGKGERDADAGAGAGVAAVVAAFASVPGRLHLGSHAVAIAACGTVLARGGMGKRGRARAKTE
jgi:hypothetical protein